MANDRPTRSLESDPSDIGLAKTMAAGTRTEFAADAPLVPGDCLGRYTLGERLGAGGMGEVYAAHDPELDRRVAVKVLHSGEGGLSGHARARFQREALAMARLNHPNVISVFDVGTVGKRFFVAMELVDGPTLDAWLAAQPRSWREVVRVFLDAAGGLAAAHAAGIIHRDFKPSNVLIGDRVRVADFGLARRDLTDDLPTAAVSGTLLDVAVTQEGAVIGTPAYMAPELLEGKPPTAASDQYSFCVALHEALHGVRPDATAAPSPPRDVPGWLRAICARGLERRSEDRFPAMVALIAELVRARDHRRRNGLLVAAGVVAIAVVLWMRLRPAPVAPAPDLEAIVYGNLAAGATITDYAVSRDGLLLGLATENAVWVEPLAGGARTIVTLPPGLGPSQSFALSPNGDTITAQFTPAGHPQEFWSIDVKSGTSERRLQPAAGDNFRWEETGPNGELLGVALDENGKNLQRVVSLGRDGTMKTLFTGHGYLANVTVSEDGARLAVREYAGVVPHTVVFNAIDGRVTHDIAHDCRHGAWLSSTAIGCIEVRDATPVLMEVSLADDGTMTTRDRWVGPPYTLVQGETATSAGVFLSMNTLETRLAIVDRRGAMPATSLTTGSITDGAPAGWTPSGSLIFGANMHGRLEIMALRPDGRIDVVRAAPQAEVPLAVLGEDILFGRFPGGEGSIPRADEIYGRRYPDPGELYRLRASGELVDLGPSHGFIDLRCAGDRQPPCLVIEHSGNDARAVAIDPETGARGAVRARWSLLSESYAALAPDGHTLVSIADGVAEKDSLRIRDLDGGSQRRIRFAGILRFLAWDADGGLVMTCYSDEPTLILCRLRGESIEPLLSNRIKDTWYLEPRVSLDGTRLAEPRTDSSTSYLWLPYRPGR